MRERSTPASLAAAQIGLVAGALLLCACSDTATSASVSEHPEVGAEAVGPDASSTTPSAPSRSPLAGSQGTDEATSVVQASGAAPQEDTADKPAAAEPLVAPNGDQMRPCPKAADLPEAMSCIPGGPFERGSDAHWDHAKPAAQVWVQSFLMDQYEVTYAEYKACQKAGDCNRAGPQYVDFDRPAQPINGISWFDAEKYCKAYNKRLPTEAEWEKAARGGDARLYPWGDEEATCEHAIIKGAEGRGCGVLKGGKKPDTGYPWNVGSRPANPYGLYDMAGNAYEWVADWFATSYEACGEACAGVDPKGPCQGASECHGFRRKVVRGGSWYWDPTRATTIYRRAHVPVNQPFHHFGFRCAADLGADVRAPQVKWRAQLREGVGPGGDPGKP